MNSRRVFLRNVLATGMGVSLTSGRLNAQDPVVRHGPVRFRLGVAAYSYRKYLNLSQKPRPAMTLEELIHLSADMDLDGVELTSYYFPETTAAYLTRLKGLCTRLGLEISGTSVGNNFCVSEPARLKEQIALVKKWVEHSSLLGAKTIRIFAGNVGKGDTEEKARKRCAEAVAESCDHAGKYGIYLALENHGGITATAEQTLLLLEEIRHDWFGVNLDTGNFHSADPYAEMARLAPQAINVHVKTEIHRSGKKAEEADLKKILEILKAAGYRGYLVLEYEAAEDPKTAVPRHMATLRRLTAG